MNNKNNNAREIFQRAIEIPELDRRRAFIETSCGDDVELRKLVDGLIAAHEDATGILCSGRDSGLEFQGKDKSLPETTPGSYFDLSNTVISAKYKLIENIGEGGMGSVWVAEQLSPVKRRVAIKMIKAGMDSKQVLARFDAERQALALMDHPNIAKVYDGGITEQGRPYFVMEFVRGIPFTEYCDQARVSLKDRLNLFIPVCSAVQHAHQKGIVHRDLKPSNILICLYDGKPVPKVIDFGLAKALHQSLTENSIYTGHGAMVGTPLYMSPEQAEQNNLDVDTRADIYSLGVILYELLVGSTPVEKAQMKKAAWNEILRLIKEFEPPRPSTRLSGSVGLPSIAAMRNIEPNQLRKSLSGDLDWIVMKALEKERGRRYDTATALAGDLHHYLVGEPVDAHPPSRVYRVQKFIRRNKGFVFATSAISTLLILLTVVSVTLGWKASIAQSDADRNAKEAIGLAREANESRKLAESRTQDLLRQVSNMEQLFSSLPPDSELLDDNTLREILGKRLIETAKLLENGNFGAEELVLLSSIGAALSSLALPEESMSVNSRVMFLAEQINCEEKTFALFRFRMAASHNGLSQFAETIKTLEDDARTLSGDVSISLEHRIGAINTLAYAYKETRQRTKAKEMYQLIQKMLTPPALQLDELSPQMADRWLAKCEWGIADCDLSISANARNLELLEIAQQRIEQTMGEQHITALSSLRQLAQRAGGLELHSKAQQYAESAWQRANSQFGPASHVALLCANTMVTAYGRDASNPASIERLKDILPEAETAYFMLSQRLRDNHSVSISFLGNLAAGYGIVGEQEKGIELRRQAIKIAEKQFGRDAEFTQNQIRGLAIALKEHGDLAESITLFEEVMDYHKTKLGAEAPETQKLATEIATLRRLQWPQDAAAQALEKTK